MRNDLQRPAVSAFDPADPRRRATSRPSGWKGWTWLALADGVVMAAGDWVGAYESSDGRHAGLIPAAADRRSRKNIRLLYGHPLIAWALPRLARASGADRVDRR
jgi:hypothetical protein